MEKTHHLAELSPSYSHSTCVSTKTRGHGFLYDDYARAIPVVPIANDWRARSLTTVRFKSPLYIATCLALVIFVVQLGISLTDVPSTQLLENLICHEASQNTASKLLPEKQCQGIAVQAELNVISMGTLILGYLPGLLVAIPYGILSDRFGRKAVLGLSVFGMVVSQLLWAVIAWNWQRWNLRYTWTSSTILLIGGGESVAQAMIFTMMTDVQPQDKSSIYLKITMYAIMLGEAVAPFVAAAMMTYSLWLPLLAAPAIIAIGGLFIPIIPDTLGMKRYRELHSKSSPNPDPQLFGCLPQHKTLNFDPSSTPWSPLCDTAQATIRLLKARDVKLLLPCASLAIPVITVSINIVLRFIPVRFGWTITQTGMMLGARTSLNILALVAFLPFLGYILSKICRGYERDLLLARISSVLLVVGQATLAAAPNLAAAMAGLVVMTLGSGAPSLCRACLVRLAADEGHSIGLVFGVLAFCEALGYIVCSVGLGALYQVGIHLAALSSDKNNEDAGWLTLVFYVAATVLFCCGGLLGVLNAESYPRRDEADLEGNSTGVTRRSTLTGDERKLHEARTSADGRIVRKGPFLESVCLSA